MQVMLVRLMSKGEYLIVPKGTKFTGAGRLGLDAQYCTGKSKEVYPLTFGRAQSEEIHNILRKVWKLYTQSIHL